MQVRESASPGVLLDVLNGDSLLVINNENLVQEVHALRGELLHSFLDVGDFRPAGPHLLQPTSKHKFLQGGQQADQATQC